MIILTPEEIAGVRLNFLTQVIVFLKSLVMIPVSYIGFLIFCIKEVFTIPSTTVNVIFMSEKIKKVIRQKLKDTDNANL